MNQKELAQKWHKLIKLVALAYIFKKGNKTHPHQAYESQIVFTTDAKEKSLFERIELKPEDNSVRGRYSRDRSPLYFRAVPSHRNGFPINLAA